MQWFFRSKYVPLHSKLADKCEGMCYISPLDPIYLQTGSNSVKGFRIFLQLFCYQAPPSFDQFGWPGADPGMSPFWQLNHANSAYFGTISANFPSISTLGPLFLQILGPALLTAYKGCSMNGMVWDSMVQ